MSVVVAADSTTQTCTPPNSVGVNRPVGADASTYTYNCTNGLWENAYYSFNPATDATTPLYAIVYTYNPTTGLYDYPDWIFDAPSSSYVEQTESIAQPPSGADVVGAPAPAPTPSTPSSDPGSAGNSISNTGPGSNNTINDNGSDGTGSISNTGPNSNNTLGGNSSNDLTQNNNTNLNVDNVVGQNATTGNSLVIGNTSAGNATSGDATDTANVINLLQSAANALGPNTLTFVDNINGNVDGNLLLDPSTLSDVQPATSGNANGNNNITINNQSDATINNNLDLDANTGNATTTQNTTGGNATSGSAEAIANVVNLINSAITSGQSFVGEININGDLNGNIEIPDNLVNQLIANNVPTDTISETGPNSTNSITDTASNNTNVTNTNNQGINNNVNANSSTGQADVSNNTTGGNATSGNATNTITAFNLTGSSVVGANDLLVFVNVLGSWVGMIINAPAGATAAEIGGGVTQDSANQNNNTTINNTTNAQINNNIETNATSGNATVSGNTTGGNATSGNAGSAVNLLNVENSDLSLSGWFGILFINVFGTWNGSFGSESDFPDLATAASSDNVADASPMTAPVFRFAATPSGSTSGSSSGAGIGNTGTQSGGTGSGTISATLVADHKPSFGSTTAVSTTPKLQSAHRSFLVPIIGVSIFIVYIIGERAYVIRSRRRHTTK